MLAFFDNLPSAACWQPTMLLRMAQREKADCGANADPCVLFDFSLCGAAMSSYAVRAVSPYDCRGPASHCGAGLPPLIRSLGMY